MKIKNLTFSAQKGTPGHCFAAQIWAEDGSSLAIIEPTENEDDATAIAQLMHASPEMLEALKTALHGFKQVEDCDKYRNTINIIEEAIKKATQKPKEFKLPVDYNSLNAKSRKKVREQYVEEQNGKCFYCGESLTGPPPIKVTSKEINLKAFPPGFLNAPIHLQHDHTTGLTEGAVHGYCNAVLWQYEFR